MFIGILPIIGAIGTAVGVFGQISSINSQRRQAEEQKRAIRAQEESATQNIALRLQEIQRQRMYANYAAELQRMGRQNEFKFQQNQQQLEAQQINTEAEQLRLQSMMQQMQAQSQAMQEAASMQRTVDQRSGQRDLQNAQFQGEQAIASNNLYGNQMGQIVGEYGQRNQLKAQQELGFNQSMNQITGQYANQQLAAGNQSIQGEQQALGQQQQLEQMAAQGNLAAQQALQQMGNMRLGLSNDAGVSMSDEALMQQQLEQIQNDAIRRRMGMNQGQSEIDSAVELNRQMAQFAGNEATRNFGQQTQQLLQGMGVERNQLENRLALQNYGRGLESENLAARQGLGGFMSQFSQLQGELGDQQNLDAGLQGIANAQEMANRTAQMEQIMALADSGLSMEALNNLMQASKDQNFLASQSEKLNALFQDIGLSQQAFSINNAGNANLAALRAERANIKKPGLLSYASAIGQGLQGIRPMFGGGFQPPTQQTPVNFGGFLSGMQPMSQANITPASSFTNAGSYGTGSLNFGGSPYQRNMTDFDYRA